MQGFPATMNGEIDEGGAVGWGHLERVDADDAAGD